MNKALEEGCISLGQLAVGGAYHNVVHLQRLLTHGVYPCSQRGDVVLKIAEALLKRIGAHLDLVKNKYQLAQNAGLLVGLAVVGVLYLLLDLLKVGVLLLKYLKRLSRHLGKLIVAVDIGGCAGKHQYLSVCGVKLRKAALGLLESPAQIAKGYLHAQHMLARLQIEQHILSVLLNRLHAVTCGIGEFDVLSLLTYLAAVNKHTAMSVCAAQHILLCLEGNLVKPGNLYIYLPLHP